MLEKRFKNFKISQVPPLIPPPPFKFAPQIFTRGVTLGEKMIGKWVGQKNWFSKLIYTPVFPLKKKDEQWKWRNIIWKYEHLDNRRLFRETLKVNQSFKSPHLTWRFFEFLSSFSASSHTCMPRDSNTWEQKKRYMNSGDVTPTPSFYTWENIGR